MLIKIYSPTAVQQNSEEWTRTHAVGTGPFQLVDYQADSYAKFKRFDGYWGGKPYLDGIEVRVVPDPMTALASLKANESDMWFTGTGLPLKELSELLNQGFKSNYFSAWLGSLVPDSANADSPYSKQSVREAVEYAIDKTKLAKTLGYGFMEPLTQLTFSFSLGYGKDNPVRSYDPAKARQLLTEAGLSSGFSTKIVVLDDAYYKDIATAIQGYLGAVGINAQLDIADSGRFGNLTRDTTGKYTYNNGLILVNLPYDPGIAAAQQFVKVFKLGGRYPSLARSAALNPLVDKINGCNSVQEAATLYQQLVAQASKEEMAIPVITLPDEVVYQPKVHTGLFKISLWTGSWVPATDWMEK
jgi:ABC-type transport system substrate-binding protein